MAKKKEAPVKKAAVKKSAVKKAAAPKKTTASKKAVSPKRTVAKLTKANAVKETKKIVSSNKIVKDATQLLADAIIEGVLEVKGRNISVLNLKSIHNRVCDYFIICQADSNTQVNAIAGSVEETVKKLTGEKPYRKEGFENSEWILVDYVTVVVHIFQSHIRNFYNLESLWADADVTEIAFD
jgi:ribosome-associated protein